MRFYTLDCIYSKTEKMKKKKQRMKTLKFIGIIAILTFVHYSCSDEDTDLIPSQTIIMEGEGGNKAITFEVSDWRIVGIINRNGNVRISGDIFDKNGKLVKENSWLELNGLGKLDASWLDKGFRIYRNTGNSLEIEVHENATNEEFNFVIIIENEGKTKEIFVSQKISEGYTFESIEYFLSEDDGDILSVRKNGNYSINVTNPQEVVISPFGGVDITNTSYFISDDFNAFVWFEGDFPEVEVPSSIANGKIYLTDEKRIYGEIFERWYEEYDVVKEKVELSAEESEFHVELEWRKRQVSYRLTMKNKRTGNLKTIEGKWLETTPTGKYTIIRDF